MSLTELTTPTAVETLPPAPVVETLPTDPVAVEPVAVQAAAPSEPADAEPEPLSADEEQRIVQALQDVIEVNHASRDMLKELASGVEDIKLAATLRTIAGQRQRQAHELTRFVDYTRGDGENRIREVLSRLLAVAEDDAVGDARLVSQLRETELRVAAIYTEAAQITEGLSIHGVLQRHLRNTQTQLGRLSNLAV